MVSGLVKSYLASIRGDIAPASLKLAKDYDFLLPGSGIRGDIAPASLKRLPPWTAIAARRASGAISPQPH